MRPTLVVFAMVQAVLLLVGCSEPEPSYLTSVVAFDQRLTGRWRVEMDEKDDVKVEIAIAPRTLEVAEGRLKPEPLDEDAAKTMARNAAGPPNAFVASIAGDSVGADGKHDHVEIELKGFVLNIDGERFVTFQPSVKQMNAAHLGGLVLPIHQVVRIRGEGDVITAWSPKVAIGWLPEVTWLDAPSEPLPVEPDLGDLAHEQRRVTMDADRFVAVLRKYAKIDGFWVEPKVLKRVK